MKAGRELDALVAEKVMGATVVYPYRSEPGHPYPGVNPLWTDEPWQDTSNPQSISGLENVPHYSTNIADAWEVVHKLREGNLWFVIKQDNSSGWEAKFWKGLPDGWFPTEEYYAVALTPALAICLVALKAKGVTDEQHG